MADEPFKRYLCLGCGFLYDEQLGLPQEGIAPGTRWADIPDDWVCFDCGTPKHRFEMVEIPYAPTNPTLPLPRARATDLENIMHGSFTLRAAERGLTTIKSTGPTSSYVAGHPDAVLTRHSSFNFNDYQSGRAGFGRVRVFGDEVFSGSGCGYNMHAHHDFVICAFVLDGQLTHINTVGNVDQLSRNDYYVFSAGSGGKHSELNLRGDDMNAIYIWFLPEKLYLPPSYRRSHFDAQAGRNSLVTLVGEADGALPIPQDVRVSRFVADAPIGQTYRLISPRHGVYAFVIDGTVKFNGTSLGRRDSAAVWGVDSVTYEASGDADVLFVETVM